jgi:hypothetical protein
MLLENNEHTFHLKVQGEKTQEWFEGDFTVHCVLNNSQQMDVALRADRYNGGSRTLPEQYRVFNRMMAELDVRIKKSPTWWQESNGGWNMHDSNVVNEVFVETLKGEKVWSDRLKAKADAAEKKAESNPVKKKKSEAAEA